MSSDSFKAFTIVSLFLFLVFGFFVYPCSGQETFQRIEIPSSFNPVGSGARALGMGGAFIAVADDATAASWNPGGLIQLEKPEISIVYDSFHRIEDLDFGANPEGRGDQTISKGAINYASAAYPFTLLGRNMIVSLTYQRLYDFTRQWDFRLNSNIDGMIRTDNYHYKQEGDLSAIGLAYSIQVTPRFSFGLTLNLWDDDLSPNEWEQKLIQTGSGIDHGNALFTSQSLTMDKYSFSGVNANFGLLWNMFPKLTIGAVLKTPFEADLKHEHSFYGNLRYPNLPKFGSDFENSWELKEQLKMPVSVGFGFAYQLKRNFIVSMDVYRTEWDDFILTDSNGQDISPVSGSPLAESDIDPTHQVRIGMEYLFITSEHIIPLCAGAFYDPAPAPGNPDDIFGFSLGSGIGWRKFHFDMAYQFRFGKNISEHIMKDRSFGETTEQHTVHSSLIFHF